MMTINNKQASARQHMQFRLNSALEQHAALTRDIQNDSQQELNESRVRGMLSSLQFLQVLNGKIEALKEALEAMDYMINAAD